MQDNACYFYTAETSIGHRCSGLIMVLAGEKNAPSLAWGLAVDEATKELGDRVLITEFRRVE